MGVAGNPSGLRVRNQADLALRTNVLRLACVDDLIRKSDHWGYLARDAEGDPSFDSRTIAALLKDGLLEQMGERDQRGRVMRVRTSTYGRRELTRLARAAASSE